MTHSTTAHTLHEYAAKETHKALRADTDKERRHHLDIAKALHDAAEYIECEEILKAAEA
jgi:hypothetical protein